MMKGKKLAKEFERELRKGVAATIAAWTVREGGMGVNLGNEGGHSRPDTQSDINKVSRGEFSAGGSE